MGLSDNIENIYKKHSFIYEVNGEYYFIGSRIFQECYNNTAINCYIEYNKIVDDNEQSKEALILFKKIRHYSNVQLETNNMNEKSIKNNKFENKINEFINALTIEQRNSLQRQLNNYIKCYQLS